MLSMMIPVEWISDHIMRLILCSVSAAKGGRDADYLRMFSPKFPNMVNRGLHGILQGP